MMTIDNADVLYNNLFNKKYNLKDEAFVIDLNIYEVFKAIDYTQTQIGKQFLYHTLCNPKISVVEIEILESELTYLESNQNLQKSFNDASKKLKDPNTHLLPELFYSNDIIQPKYNKVVPFLICIELIFLFLGFYNESFFIALLPLFFINTFIHLINKNRLYLFRKTYNPVSQLLDSAIEIKGSDKSCIFFTERVDSSVKSLSPLKAKLTVLTIVDYFSTSELYLIAFLFMEIIKMVTLFEVLLTKSLIKAINEKKNAIKTLYLVIGKIDLLSSISLLRKNVEDWCSPEFKSSSSKKCNLESIYHPLIANAIRNNLSLIDKSVIISGSNMSGKTTFLRTVGVNNILGQTINTCFAKTFTIPFSKTVTSLQNLDDLMEGKSFYFAEAKNILEVLNSDLNSSYLIIVDELFKGTNSLERTSISKATLNYLHKNCGIVLASTHDLDLINLLMEDFEPYHFNENFNDHEILFDYKIKKGKLYIFNAIKTLEKMGFPRLLMDDARETFNSLEFKYLENSTN